MLGTRMENLGLSTSHPREYTVEFDDSGQPANCDCTTTAAAAVAASLYKAAGPKLRRCKVADLPLYQLRFYLVGCVIELLVFSSHFVSLSM